MLFDPHHDPPLLVSDSVQVPSARPDQVGSSYDDAEEQAKGNNAPRLRSGNGEGVEQNKSQAAAQYDVTRNDYDQGHRDGNQRRDQWHHGEGDAKHGGDSLTSTESQEWRPVVSSQDSDGGEKYRPMRSAQGCGKVDSKHPFNGIQNENCEPRTGTQFTEDVPSTGIAAPHHPDVYTLQPMSQDIGDGHAAYQICQDHRSNYGEGHGRLDAVLLRIGAWGAAWPGG